MINKKFFIISFSLFTATLALSCDGAKVRRLVSTAHEMQRVEDKYEEKSSAGESRYDGEKQSRDAGEGLELPAKLKDRAEMILHRAGYTVSYNRNMLIPNWVAWHLTPEHASGHIKRDGIDFAEDTDVPEPRAVDADYYGSRYDRGHMCPAGDNKWSKVAMEQSFLFTNICPQNSNLNRGDWNELENACRSWAKKKGGLYIVCGPILYKQKHKTIGHNRVTVPEAFFKVVLCMEGTPRAIGFIYKNAADNRPKGDYANTVDEVERITGIDFFPSLPDDVEKRVEAEKNIEDW